MDARHLLLLIFSGFGAIALFSFRERIMEAIRRGPWGGGSPPAGPLGAADPFRKRPKNTRIRG